MQTRSRKAKGRKLQNWVRDEFLARFKQFTDVKFSPLAQETLPYSIECKNKETFKGIYDIMEQAKSNTKVNHTPVGVIKMNNCEPLAIVNAKHFLDLIKKDKI